MGSNPDDGTIAYDTDNDSNKTGEMNGATITSCLKVHLCRTGNMVLAGQKIVRQNRDTGTSLPSVERRIFKYTVFDIC